MLRKATILAILLLTAGCASLKPSPSLPQPKRIKTAEETIKGITARQGEIKTFSAMARIKITDKKRGNRGLRGIITIDGEKRLRIESLDILGQPHITIVKNGDEVRIYDAEENALYDKTDVPDIIYDLTGLDMSVEVINRIVTQRLISGGERILDFSPGEDNSRLSVEKTDGERVDISLGGELLASSAIYTNSLGKITERVYYFDYRKIQAEIYYPQNIRVELPQSGVSVNINLSEVEINRDINEEIFRLEVPQI